MVSDGSIINGDYFPGGSWTGSATVHDYPYTPAPTCTDFTYSEWSVCTNHIQAKKIISSTPDGCTGGSPDILSQSCVGGLEWSDIQGPMTWDDAMAASSTFQGGGWRMPDVNELENALNDQFINGYDHGFIDDSVYWSGITYVDNETRAWTGYVFSSITGIANGGEKSSQYLVRYIRP